MSSSTGQRTLRKAISMDGIGLHSGKKIHLTIRPAGVNEGITFVRTDLEGSPEIPARHSNIVSTQLATTLGRGKATVSTVEHVMAAFQLMAIDNARVEVSGPEIPIMDGSSAAFIEALSSAGAEYQNRARPTLVLRKRVEIKINEKWALAEPSARFEVLGSVDWDHPAIGFQEFHYIEGRTPLSQLATARTFCFLKDVEAMQRMGLALGGSLDNALVMNDTAVLNPGGMRFPNECARHKVLDALGDFKLAGIQLQGYFRLHRAGHELHSLLLNEILRHPDHYEIMDPVTSDFVPTRELQPAMAI